MNSKAWTRTVGLALFAALAMPVQLPAQDNQGHHNHHHHYQFVDIGTFGGPNSYNFSAGRALNNNGTLVGFADTPLPDPFALYFFDQFVDHAFTAQSEAGLKDLGALRRGFSSAPTSISASGLVAGFSENGEIDPLFAGYPEERAVLWTHGEIRDLGTLEGGHESAANAVNSHGQVVGGSLNTIPDSHAMTLNSSSFFLQIPYQVRAFLWQDGVMEDLGTLGGTDAQATLINDDGEVVGLSYTSSVLSAACNDGVTTGSFLWERNKGMVDLGNLGGSCTQATDLNNKGQVVGIALLPGDTTNRAFIWDGSIQDLGGSLGGINTGAFAMNDKGQAVGYAYLAGDTIFHAALWRGVGKITDLGAVGNDLCSFASAINAKMQVVGGSKSTCDPESGIRAFLWENNSIVDMNALIPSGSPLYLQSASNINDHGEIAGQGVDGSGNQHAFLLIPCDENHSGVEGCDYSLMAADAAAASPNQANIAQQAVKNNADVTSPNEIRDRARQRLIRQHGFPNLASPNN